MNGILKFGFRNLARRRSRSALTMLGVILAIGFTVGLLSISEGFLKSFDQVFAQSGPELFLMPKGESKMPFPLRGSGEMPESASAEAAKIEGVKFVEPLYQTFSVQTGGFAFGMPSLVFGVPPKTFYKMRPFVEFADGRAIKQGDRGAVVLGSIIADNLDARVGDEISLLLGSRLKVVGIMKKSGYVVDHFGYAPLREIQKMQDDPGKIHFVMIKLERVDDVDKVAARFKKKFPDYDVQSINEMLQEAKRMMAMARVIHLCISAFALLIGVLFVACTMIMSVSERGREFATLRAIGAPRSYVMKLIFSESVILSLIGGVAGCWFGVLLSMVINAIHSHYVGETLIHTLVSPRIFSAGIGIAVLIGALAGFAPALVIMKKNLADSLKYE